MSDFGFIVIRQLSQEVKVLEKLIKVPVSIGFRQWDKTWVNVFMDIIIEVEGKQNTDGSDMEDETRKKLTEYLGECRHEPVAILTDMPEYAKSYMCSCGAEGWPEPCQNRTFSCPDDADALRRKMVEKGNGISL